MRNTLAFLGALALAVAGLGWYLGWYQVFFAPGKGGHETVKIDINTDKVDADLKNGEEKVLQEGKKELSGLKAAGDSKSSPPAPPAGVPEEQEALPPLPTPFGGTTGRK